MVKPLSSRCTCTTACGVLLLLFISVEPESIHALKSEERGARRVVVIMHHASCTGDEPIGSGDVGIATSKPDASARPTGARGVLTHPKPLRLDSI